MIMKRLLLVSLLLAAGCSTAVNNLPCDMPLSDGWKIRSSATVVESGEELSSPGNVLSEGWYDATVPSTVLGTLTSNSLYGDALVGTNYDKVIDRDSFSRPWWYVKEFESPVLKEGQRAFLEFDGISYRADIWFNGASLASSDVVRGPFRQFRIDVTDLLQEHNILSVKVYRAEAGEFNIGFVDWNPRPADESMGIFRPVRLTFSGDVSITSPAVRSKVDTATLKSALLDVEATLTNHSGRKVDGVLKGTMEGRSFRYPVSLEAGESRKVTVSPADAGMLSVDSPRLWWCHNLGSPQMYSIDLSFVSDGEVSDACTVDFGIRQIDTYFTPQGHRGFILNGKKVLIKGAGWTDDIFLRNDTLRNATELAYVKDMNLNAIRLENFWGTSQDLYDRCDREGILILAGWSCFWEWQVYSGVPDDAYGCIRRPEDMDLVAESFRDQVLWLRNHPSLIAWYTGSDKMPREELERKYLDILSQTDDRPCISSAKALTSTLSGPAGMKMVGPYDYQAPEYWYNDDAPGGAFGFNTETGIGAQMPEKESLLKMIPVDELWPLGAAYDYHCTKADEAMHSLDVLKDVVERRYGPSDNLDDFLLKAQHLDYDGTRAMFEAFRVRTGEATGIIQWMLNSAWPSLYWQLYDWYLVPCSGYWSVRKACRSCQMVYNYNDGYAYAVNDEKTLVSLSASAELYSLDGSLLTQLSRDVTIPAGGSVRLFPIPESDKVSFLFLTLKDDGANEVAYNSYCLSPDKDEHDWSAYNWIRTPLKRCADYSSLKDLAKTDLAVSSVQKGDVVEVEVENGPDAVAFFIRLALKDAAGELITPAFWSDNRFSLKPSERRTLTCSVKDLPDGWTLDVSGWNLR